MPDDDRSRPPEPPPPVPLTGPDVERQLGTVRPGEAVGFLVAMMLVLLVCGVLALCIVWVYGMLADALRSVGA